MIKELLQSERERIEDCIEQYLKSTEKERYHDEFIDDILSTHSKLLHAVKEEVEGMMKSKKYKAMVESGDLSFLNFTPTEIYTKALSDLLSKLEAIN